jgi:hypothetical protein
MAIKTTDSSKTQQQIQEYKNYLEELAFKYGTDKCSQIKHSYTDFYYNMFKDKTNSVHKLLEIGVGTKYAHLSPSYVDGASLFMWRDFFPKAKIYGIDIIKNLVFKKGRIQTYLCDQGNSVKLTKLIKKIGRDIDVVIDDGSHKPEDIITSCQTLMPLLKKDVIYIIEDTDRVSSTIVLENLKIYDCHVVRHC